MSYDIRELFQGVFFLPDVLNLRKRFQFSNYLHKKGIGGFIEVHEPLNFSRGFLELGINLTMWIKQAFRDYYKPKLRRELKRDPTQEEMDRRFDEIYSRINCILLAGIYKGVGLQFYEIARFTKEEVDAFRGGPEEYLAERFGGGWFKLNFYEGPTFIVCVNFKPKGEPKWKQLITEKSEGSPPL